MILSHKYKFIYLKTLKTASSSIETLLSEICGPDDVVTPAKDSIMKHRGAIKHQNYILKHPDVPKRKWYKRMLRRPIRHYDPCNGFYEHMPAWRIRKYVGEDVWSNYYKFTFERNPWDRQVSYYHYKCRDKGKQISFSQFLGNRRKAYVDNWGIYTINNEPSVDFIGRYENLSEDFNLIKSRLGLPEDLVLPRINKSSKTLDYRNYYSDQTCHLINDWYKNEINQFRYVF